MALRRLDIAPLGGTVQSVGGSVAHRHQAPEETVYAIMDAAEIPELAAEDLQVILAGRRFDFDSAAMGEETEFSSDAHYQEKGVYHSEWASEWHDFERPRRHSRAPTSYA